MLPYCWHDNGTLSNHELKMDDEHLSKPHRPDRHRGDAPGKWELALFDPLDLALNLAIAVGPGNQLCQVTKECLGQ